MASDIKIIVLKRVDPSVIFDGKVPNMPGSDKPYAICPAFEEGQEFVVGQDGNRPEGFCGWAWRDIYKDLSVLRFGGDFTGWAYEGTQITCCTDGIRPVSFKLERIEG